MILQDCERFIYRDILKFWCFCPLFLKVVPSKRNQMHEGNLYGCFGNWKLLIPSCLRSRTSSKPNNRKKKKEMQKVSYHSQLANVMKILKVGKFSRSFSPLIKNFIITLRQYDLCMIFLLAGEKKKRFFYQNVFINAQALLRFQFWRRFFSSWYVTINRTHHLKLKSFSSFSSNLLLLENSDFFPGILVHVNTLLLE